ncbi:succinate dehydrogenase / fumarate reductase, cytochrome b subunit [Marinicellulosiphila megalodicopiae]
MMLVGLAFLLWALYISLQSQAGFDHVASVMTHPFAKFIAWGIVSSFLYHLVAGVKHLIMDTGVGETLQGGRIMATATLIISTLLIIGAGVWFYAS